MGSYATTTSLSTLAVGTSFDTATTSLATQCIGWGESEINRALGRRYDVSAWTSGNVPPQVTTMAERFGLGYFYQAMSRGSKESLTRAKEMLKDVREELNMIADYDTALVNTAGALVTERSGDGIGVLSNTEDYIPTFGEDDPLNWDPDEDKLDDIASDRS